MLKKHLVEVSQELPSDLEGVVRMPVVFAPWYIYTATLVASPASYEFMDILFPDVAGKFDRLVTDDAVVDTGYAFALEKFTTGDTTVQVAVPGSAVPFIGNGIIRPTQLVKFNFASSKQTVTAALAADLAAGKVLGRCRNHHEDHENLRVTATDDVLIILTGCA